MGVLTHPFTFSGDRLLRGHYYGHGGWDYEGRSFGGTVLAVLYGPEGLELRRFGKGGSSKFFSPTVLQLILIKGEGPNGIFQQRKSKLINPEGLSLGDHLQREDPGR